MPTSTRANSHVAFVLASAQAVALSLRGWKNHAGPRLLPGSKRSSVRSETEANPRGSASVSPGLRAPERVHSSEPWPATAAPGPGRVSLGVIAVDPSSRISGGALLGDRARIAPDPADEGVFVRSVATGNELGGLAEGVPEAVVLLSYAFDWVVVETVGVGQSEADVSDVADVAIAFVSAARVGRRAPISPRRGSSELPDVFVVNKSDLGDLATRALRDLRHALHVAGAVGSGTHSPTVVEVSALTRANVPALFDALLAAWNVVETSGVLRKRRINGTAAAIARRIVKDVGESAIERAGGRRAFEAKIANALEDGASAQAVKRAAKEWLGT